MSSTTHFYQIDGGPSGIWWEGRIDDGPYIGVFNDTTMMEAARILSLADHPIRFHTQAEWELDSQLREALGGSNDSFL